MKQQDRGCVLRLLPLGDYGVIVYWCTERHGILHTAARNARKPGSDFAGRLDLFHECELLFTPAKQGGLSALSSVALLEPRLAIRSSLNRLCLAGYMARLLLSTVETEAPAEDWHGLMSGALDYLNRNEARQAILLHFEKRLAELHGLYSREVLPYRALLRHFRNLPSDREELLQKLPR